METFKASVSRCMAVRDKEVNFFDDSSLVALVSFLDQSQSPSRRSRPLPFAMDVWADKDRYDTQFIGELGESEAGRCDELCEAAEDDYLSPLFIDPRVRWSEGKRS